MDDLVAVVGDTAGEADVGGAVQQHVVALPQEDVQSGDNAAQNAVLIADVLGLQINAVTGLLPVDDGVEVLLGLIEVAVVGLLGTLNDSGGNALIGGDVHVGDPHGDLGEALLNGGAGDGDTVHSVGPGALTGSDKVHRTKIVLAHYVRPLSFIFCSGNGPRNATIFAVQSRLWGYVGSFLPVSTLIVSGKDFTVKGLENISTFSSNSASEIMQNR